MLINMEHILMTEPRPIVGIAKPAVVPFTAAELCCRPGQPDIQKAVGYKC